MSADGSSFYLTRDYGQGRDIYRSTYLGDPNIEPNAPAGDYYVDAVHGSDSYNGLTPVTPFASIQRGINVAQSGDVVVVAPGEYTGSGNKNLNFGGRSITLQSSGGAAQTTINCQGSGQAFIFQNGESENAMVDGFTLTNGNTQTGGAIYFLGGSSPRIMNCIISNNSGYYAGGVYCSNNSSPSFVDCTFRGNSGTQGGAIRLVQSQALLLNCLIVGNTSSGPGGGIRCDYGNQISPIIANCTIADNTAGNAGGGLWASYCTPIIRNCIFWNNAGTQVSGQQLAVGTAGTLTVSFCIVQGGQTGVYKYNGTLAWNGGNLDSDPLFADPAAGDYHLQSERGRYWPAEGLWVIDAQTSPGVDGGDPADDVMDERSPNGGIINMGAYGGTYYASMSLDCSGGGSQLEGDVNGDGVIEFSDLFELIDIWLNLYGSSMGSSI